MRERDEVPYIVIERGGSGIGAFLFGTILGAGAALLFAPRSGEETQREIKERALRFKGAAEERVREVQTQLEERLDNARSEVRDRVDTLRDAVDSGKKAASEARADLETKLERSKAAYRAGLDAARASAEEGEGEA